MEYFTLGAIIYLVFYTVNLKQKMVNVADANLAVNLAMQESIENLQNICKYQHESIANLRITIEVLRNEIKEKK